MQLTQYTDFAFRALIALASVAPEKLTASEISESYGISLNHLLKVVQRMAELGYVETLRGKAGGVRLAVEPSSLRLGQVVRGMEPELGLVPCLRQEDADCRLLPACRLRGILQQSTQQFLESLDQYTLADIAGSRKRVQQLLELRRPA